MLVGLVLQKKGFKRRFAVDLIDHIPRGCSCRDKGIVGLQSLSNISRTQIM